MPVKIEEIPLRFLEHLQSSDPQKFLFDCWRKNHGFDCPDMLEVADEMIILSTPHTHELPGILSMGKKSLASRVLGSGWRDDAKSKGDAAALASAYISLIEGGELVYQWIQYDTYNRMNEKYTLTYLRALFEFKTKTGMPYITTIAKPLGLSRKEESGLAPNPNTNLLTSQSSSSQILLGRDGSPIEAHLGSYR